MNYVQIIGRITTIPEALPHGNSRSYSRFDVSVMSNFRDRDGEYRVDIFKVQLWKGADRRILDTATINELIAIKGRLESENDQIIIIAEQLEYLRLK